MRWLRANALVISLWIVAAAIVAALAYHRYHGTVAGHGGFDFRTFVAAARLVAAGHSPYSGKRSTPYPYVYPPTIALILAPFSHISVNTLWKAWTALEVVALVLSAAIFVATQAKRLSSWVQPFVFLACAATAVHFWPVTYGLFIGQSDIFVLLTLMISTWAVSRSWPATRGALLGVAGLIKAWPAVIAVSLFQRGATDRRRSLIALVITLALAPVLALAFGGGSGLVSFVKVVFDARQQSLVSNSVWGIPKLLFSHSGLARPLFVSHPAQLAAEAVLLAWVVALLILALRTRGDAAMCTWNITLCIVLLLPVSHMAYTVLGLPLLWLWGTRVLTTRPFDRREVGVFAVLLLWWLIQSKAWPGDGSSSAISSVRFSIVFAANLVACTASVVGEWLVASGAAPDQQTGSGHTETASPVAAGVEPG